MQTRKQSHLEVLINQCLGLAGGWLIVYFLFPLFDHLSQSLVATISTIIFFIWSYIRSYTIRRYFNKNKEVMLKDLKLSEDKNARKR